MKLAIATLAFFAAAGAAFAAGPVKLTEVQMDSITAGATGTVKWYNSTKGYGASSSQRIDLLLGPPPF